MYFLFHYIYQTVELLDFLLGFVTKTYETSEGFPVMFVVTKMDILGKNMMFF